MTILLNSKGVDYVKRILTNYAKCYNRANTTSDDRRVYLRNWVTHIEEVITNRHLNNESISFEIGKYESIDETARTFNIPPSMYQILSYI